MKSLEEVQQELISIEQNVQDISKSIKSLNYEVGAIKEAARKESGQNVFDFAKIKELSQNIRITGHPLGGLGSVEERRLYIEMLLNMVRLDADQEACLNRMIYLQWLAEHSKAERSLEDLFRDSLLLTKASYAQFAKSIQEPLASVFIVDALITAYISGAVAEEVRSYLEELFAIAGFGEDKVKPIALLVKKLLSGENESFPSFGVLIGGVPVGSYVKFGRYPQNNGDSLEPIEWLVLENDGKTVLLLAKYGLDNRQFHHEKVDIGWDKCDLRKWLNSDFFNRAFDADEQRQIALSKTSTGCGGLYERIGSLFGKKYTKYYSNNSNYSAFGTSYYSRRNGYVETEDKMFCLSMEEVEEYLGEYDTRCQATAFAVNRNSRNSSNGYCCFWLRSPGGSADSAASVDNNGDVRYGDNGIYSCGASVDFYYAVRPALRIIL